MRIKEMIVVEGRDDTTAIQRAVVADTIETGGSALNQEKISKIRLAQERRGVIIFTDPDYAGERIRKIIDQAVPGCKHAFIPQEKAVSKQGKYGVEHAAPDDIRIALQHVRTIDSSDQGNNGEEMTGIELQELGLVGGPSSKRLRELLCLHLGIGYCNGKQLYKRLIAFRITRQEFEQALSEAMQEDLTHD